MASWKLFLGGDSKDDTMGTVELMERWKWRIKEDTEKERYSENQPMNKNEFENFDH